MVTSPTERGSSRLSTALGRPVTSSIVNAWRSMSVSMEMASCVYFILGTMRSSFSMAFSLLMLSSPYLATLRHQDQETEGKVIYVLTRLECQTIPLLSKLLQCGPTGAIAADAGCRDGVLGVLGSPLPREDGGHLPQDHGE